MTPTLITVKNGKARPVNPHEGSSQSASFLYASFEDTVQWHDCAGCADGGYTAELLWQIKINDEWYFSVEPTADADSRYRKVWRIVPQPQEKQSADNSTLDRLIKMVKEANYRNEQLIINLLEYNRI